MTPTTINTDIFHPPLPTIPGKPLPWQNLHGASIALALSNAIAQSQQPVLLIAPDSLSAANLITELNFFAPEIPVLSLPHWETLPYDHFSPHQDITSERLAALYRIPTLSQGVIITTAATVIHRLSPRDFLGAHSFLLKRGDQLNIEHFRNHLTKSGYYAVSQVRSPGEFAIRGSIIDLFPMGSHTPFRIDLLDDEVDSIRLFSAETQRSLEKINEIRLLPAKEFPLSEAAIEQFRQNWRSQFSGNPLKCPIYQDISEGICPPGIEYYLSFFFTSTASLFDYLPANTLILTLGNIHAKITEFWQEITLRYEQLRFDQSRPLLQPEQLFIPVNACMAALKNYLRITCDLSTLPASTPPATGQFTTAPAPTLEVQHKAAHPLAALNQFITDYSGRILFCAESAGRREVLLQLFNSIALTPTYFPSWQAFITSDEPYGITVTPIE
ncbi:MAG TPA: transcription-repair coupling factor, partial [Gammaproteobacteria bacterium]|nr:transcription-repair coupling factor [Gammaproteobacteria bacterium]